MSKMLLDLFSVDQEDPDWQNELEDSAALMDLIAALVGRRRASGIVQKEVATAMGTTQSAVSDFERLGGDPKLSTIQRYARAVGVRLALRMEERLNNGEWCEVTSSTVSGSAWTSPDRARASEFITAVPHFTAVTNDQFAISA